jgi:hypothetical protein
MKQVISVFMIAAMITACNSNPATVGKEGQTPAADTTGLAEFQALKAQAALKAMEDSIQKAKVAEEAAKKETARAPKKKSTHSASTSRSESIAYETSNPAKQKKGWSKKAKGAVIGAGTGAAAGAIINKKNRTVGGVVGGVVGAATGYGIGRHEDKKDGRN